MSDETKDDLSPDEQNSGADESSPESPDSVDDQRSSAPAGQPSTAMGETSGTDAKSDEERAREAAMLKALEAEQESSGESSSEDDVKMPGMNFAGQPDQGEPSEDVQEAHIAELQDFGTEETSEEGAAHRHDKKQNIDLLLDVQLPIAIELGRTQMNIADILELGPGSIVELERLAGEPVDLLVNNRVIARGEVVVVDENFGLRVTTLLSPQDRIKSL